MSTRQPRSPKPPKAARDPAAAREQNKQACKSYRQRLKLRKKQGLLYAKGPQHYVTRNEGPDHVHPRQPIIVCKVCYGIPSSRTCDRYNERNAVGTYPVAYPPGLGVPGHHEPVCVGCGLPYAPERETDRGSTLRSSAGMALTL